MTSDTANRPLLLLGRDYPVFGEYHASRIGGGRTIGAISAGSDPASPSMRSKGSPDEPNEDALLAVDDGDRVFFAVADSHFGMEASHRLLEELFRVGRIPSEPSELEEGLSRIPSQVEGDGPSATTLLVASFDRRQRSGFGLSFGDSSVFLVGEECARLLSARSEEFVRPWNAGDLQPGRGLPFRFRTGARQLLVAFTDGVDECHYGFPATSVRPHHLEQIFMRTGSDPDAFVGDLMGLALGGVEGKPGGQDNIALVVSRTD